MVIIRRIILIIVLLGLAFVFYRFLNPQGADALIAKLRGTSISSTIPDIKNLASTGTNLSGKVDTGIINTGIINTGIISTGVVNTGSSKTGFQSSGETIGIVDNMSGFKEVIDSPASAKIILGDISYQNSDYNFSLSFPGSRDGYTIQIDTGNNIKSEFIFSFDKKDYFILYVISNNSYKANKSSEFNYLTYLSQDSTNTFAYKILENSDSKSKAIPYILKTFKSTSITIINTPTVTVKTPTIIKSTSKPSTTPKTYPSDSNNIRSIWDSFIK